VGDVIEWRTTSIDCVVVHHTKNPQCFDDATCSGRVVGMQRDQMGNRFKLNLRDINANFLIGSTGKVYVGRGWNYQVKPRESFPKLCYEIYLIGDFSRTHPNPAAISSLDSLIALGQPYNLAPTYKLFSHYDVACALCPGVHLRNILRKRSDWGGSEVNCLPHTRGWRHSTK